MNETFEKKHLTVNYYCHSRVVTSESVSFDQVFNEILSKTAVGFTVFGFHSYDEHKITLVVDFFHTFEAVVLVGIVLLQFQKFCFKVRVTYFFFFQFPYVVVPEVCILDVSIVKAGTVSLRLQISGAQKLIQTFYIQKVVDTCYKISKKTQNLEFFLFT